jgi:hypothetical protein
VDLQALIAAARVAEDILGAKLPGKVLKAGPRVPASTASAER